MENIVPLIKQGWSHLSPHGKLVVVVVCMAARYFYLQLREANRAARGYLYQKTGRVKYNYTCDKCGKTFTEGEVDTGKTCNCKGKYYTKTKVK